jgi:glucosamine--fructose-6-phosphate aminotransferase (isomerizing)
MTQPLPVYANILNQPNALRQSLQAFRNEGKGSLVQAAKAILSARKVVVVSIGASYAASFPFIYKMAQLGIKVNLEDASELLHYTHTAYDRNTVFILISRSGETIEITRLIEPLKKLGGTLIGITNVMDSSVAKGVDILLYLNSPADELIAIQTYSVTLQTLELLWQQIAGQFDTPQVQTHFDGVLDQFTETLAVFDRHSPTWQNWFKQYESVYLLARGASQASACEGQLLFHEMAWTAATFYTAGFFRHGPWEVMQEGFLGFIFAPNDNCYELNIRLAYDIANQHGNVCLITHQIPGEFPSRIIPLIIPKVASGISPLMEIIPIQFFIYQWALWNGHNPGIFRASTAVTLSEGEPIV